MQRECPAKSTALTPGLAGEICPFLEVFSGWYQSKKIPNHLFSGIRGCLGYRCRGVSGAVTRLSCLVWTMTRGHVPSHVSLRARTNGRGERTLHEDSPRVTQASHARPLPCTTSSRQARPRPVASSHIPGDIPERLFLHGEGASWVGVQPTCHRAILPERRPCYWPFSGSGGLEGWLLDFDDAAFYRQGDRRSTSGRQRREAGRDHGAIVLG